MIHRHAIPPRGLMSALVLVVAGAAGLAWPVNVAAQTPTGQARAAQITKATLFGATTTLLADTGSLSDASEPRDAAAQIATGSVLSGEALRAVTMGWTDQAVSEASLGSLVIQLGAVRITADSVLATALAALDSGGQASSVIGNLAINGVPVFVTGAPNQRIAIPGGQLIINEQIVSPGAATVNALHATVAGVADVVVASAAAGIN